MFSKEFLNLNFILFQEVLALTVELAFNFTELRRVKLTHVQELLLHLLDKVVDVRVHVLHRFDIVFVFVVQGFFKLLFECFLVLDDLLTLDDLFLNVWR